MITLGSKLRGKAMPKEWMVEIQEQVLRQLSKVWCERWNDLLLYLYIRPHLTSSCLSPILVGTRNCV